MTDAKDMCKDVFKSDMKTAELTRELLGENEPEEIGEACLDVVEDLQDKLNDPVRLRTMYATTLQIGKVIGHKEMVELGQKGVEAYTDSEMQ